MILLGLLYEFSVGGGVSVANAGKVMLFVGVFFALATPSAKLLSRSPGHSLLPRLVSMIGSAGCARKGRFTYTNGIRSRSVVLSVVAPCSAISFSPRDTVTNLRRRAR